MYDLLSDAYEANDLLSGVLDLELERPAVDGDQLVAPGGFSMPLANVLMLEVQRFDAARTILRVGGGATAAFVVYLGLCWPDDLDSPGGPIC